MTTYNFCPNCGVPVRKDWNFCEACGRRLTPVATQELQAPPPSASAMTEPAAPNIVPEASTPPQMAVDASASIPPAESPAGPVVSSPAAPQLSSWFPAASSDVPLAAPPLRNRLSLERVVLLTLLCNGLYSFYWLYLTWKQYTAHTGAKAYPVWHALTLLVPVYGIFRVHAHARAYRDLMLQKGMRSTISPGQTIVAAIGMHVLGGAALVVGARPPLSENIAAMFALGLLALGLMAWLIAHLQSNLNAYWASVAGDRLRDAPTGVGEVVLALLGVLLWLDALSVDSPSVFRNLTTNAR